MHTARRGSGPDRRRQPGRVVDLASSGLEGRPVVDRRAASGHGDSPAGRDVQPARRSRSTEASVSKTRSCDASELEFEQDGAIVSVESLAGKELEYYFRNVNEGYEPLSPSPRLFITQIGLEPILRRHADALGARLEYSTELVSFDQDEDGATALVRNRETGAERTVRARYVVGADGSKSPVRDGLGIGLRGHPSFSKCITIYFRADVKPLLGDRNLSVIYVFGPTLQGFFRFSLAGDAGFLVVNSTTDADGARNRDVSADMSEERCVEYVREALGAPELAIEIENVQQWNACADWAERFREGQVFLAGDAAHNMPPTGGFGGNTGVADAHNLAWKLASVLDGSAGPGLLETYDAERRPVGGAHRRAGIHPLRRATRSRARNGRHPALRRGSADRARPSLPLLGRDRGERRRRLVPRESRRAIGSPRNARSARRPRQRLDARPLRARLRRPVTVRRSGVVRRRPPRSRPTGSRRPRSRRPTAPAPRVPCSSVPTASSPGGRAGRSTKASVSCPRRSPAFSTADARGGRAGRPRPGP